MELTAEKYVETVTATIRDTGHAYLAISDRFDRDGCVATLTACLATLCGVTGATMTPRPLATGISNTSLCMTLANIVSVAQTCMEEYETRACDPTVLPHELDAWVAKRGMEMLRGLSFLVATLLGEANLHKLVEKANAARN